MGETWPITDEGTLTIRKQATFDLKSVYKFLHTFAEEHNYTFNEQGYVEKVKSDGSEIQIDWTFERKVTEFIKFTIFIEVWSLRTKKINKDKKELHQGELEISIDTLMEMDYENEWEKTKFTKFLRTVYINYLRKPYFQQYAGKLWGETYEFYNTIKGKLEQNTFF